MPVPDVDIDAQQALAAELSRSLLDDLPFQVMWPETDQVAAQVQMHAAAHTTVDDLYRHFDQAIGLMVGDNGITAEQVPTLVAGIHLGVDWLAYLVANAFLTDRAFRLSEDQPARLGPDAAVVAAACSIINTNAQEAGSWDDAPQDPESETSAATEPDAAAS